MEFIYIYNDEVRARTIGHLGFIRKSNLEDVFYRSLAEYSNTSKYRTKLNELRDWNENFLDHMDEIAYFRIDCSISHDRIYIGSQDPNWSAIPSFCIPQES